MALSDPNPPTSRRITLTYEVMIFVFSAQFFLLPTSKITLTYVVMMASRLPWSGSKCPRRPQCPQVSPDSPGSSPWCPQYPQVSRNNQQRPQPCPMLAPGPKGNDTLWCVSPFHWNISRDTIDWTADRINNGCGLHEKMIYYSDAGDDFVTKWQFWILSPK